MVGPKGGIFDICRNITWTYRCKAHNSYGCEYKVKVEWNQCFKHYTIRYSSGWPHKHEGICKFQRGLPPDMKAHVCHLKNIHPKIKLKGLQHMLSVPPYNYDMGTWGNKVATFFYNSRKSSEAASTGVSSFGALATFTDGHGLYQQLAKHTPIVKDASGVDVTKPYGHVCGVIFSEFDPANDGFTVVGFSTTNMLRLPMEQKMSGLSEGQLHLDFTHKVLQERLPVWVITVADIQQHGHVVAFGIASHETEEMCQKILAETKAAAEAVMQNMLIQFDSENRVDCMALEAPNIYFGTDDATPPRGYLQELTQGDGLSQVANLPIVPEDVIDHTDGTVTVGGAKYLVYDLSCKGGGASAALTVGGEAPVEDDDDGRMCVIPMLETKCLMADAAPAIGNAAKKVFPGNDVTKADEVKVKMCWVHVWQAVDKWLMSKPFPVSDPDDRKGLKDELYQDMEALHVVPYAKHLPAMMAKFAKKWDPYHAEFVRYFNKQWRPLRWSRCHGEPGEPTDNNTLEALNRVLKAEPHFSSTSSLALALPNFCQTGAHLSVQYASKPLPLAPEVSKDVWLRAQQLCKENWPLLGFSATLKEKVGGDRPSFQGNCFVMPSTKLVKNIPPKEQNPKQYLKTWAAEYISMLKNPEYYKFKDWDFDTAADYMFSYYLMREVPPLAPPPTQTPCLTPPSHGADHLGHQRGKLPLAAQGRHLLLVQLPRLHALPRLQARRRDGHPQQEGHRAGQVQLDDGRYAPGAAPWPLLPSCPTPTPMPSGRRKAKGAGRGQAQEAQALPRDRLDHT